MNKIRIVHKINNDNFCERYIDYREYIIKFDKDTYLFEVVDKIEHSNLNIRDYYDISLRADLYKCDVPYILENDEIKWNVSINEIKVIDIINTHNINDTIFVESYIAEHGGYYNLMDLLELWESIVPILIEISKYIGILFVYEKALTKIGKVFVKKKVSPLNIIEFILSKDTWNYNELAKLLNLESEETKYFLKALGYKWDNRKLVYRNNDIKFVHNKFTQMSVITKKEFKG